MEDLFYFTKARVDIDDLESTVREAGYLADRTDLPGGPVLTIRLDATGVCCELTRLDETDMRGFDPLSLDRVSAYLPGSSFMVTYDRQTWRHLAPLLREIMAKFGGWVGFDTEGLLPTFAAETLPNDLLPGV